MKLFSIDELKQLVDVSQPPCVSLYMPTYQAGAEIQQNPIRFKNLIKQAEALLQHDYGLSETEALDFLQPAIELDRAEFWEYQNAGLAIFIGSDLLQYYRVPLEFEELVVVSDRFHFKPLLPLLSSDGQFYLLALSQKQVRLFVGTRYHIREIELEDVVTSMEEALQYDETAKEGQFRISTGKGGTNNPMPQAGSSHGQGSPDRDNIKIDILQFFHQLDQDLQKYLHNKRAPLLLAGVEYLLPIYQEANSYPHLVDKIIPVENIGVLKPDDLHRQAWAEVEPHYTQAQQEAIEHFQELAATGKTSTDLKEAIAAAYYGRVDSLFVAVGVQQWGKFDPTTDQLQTHSDVEPHDQDLLDAAAVQTLLNGGTVYAVEPDEVPASAPLAAIFRY
jgi:hypothetical protein